MKRILHRCGVELLALWLALLVTACDTGVRRSEVDGEAVGRTRQLLAKLEATRDIDLSALRALRGVAPGSICQLPPSCAQGSEEACPRIAAVRASSLLAYVQNFLGNSENLELLIARVSALKFLIREEVLKSEDPSPRLAITALSETGPVTFSSRMLAPNGAFIAQGLIAGAIVHEASHKLAPFLDDAKVVLLPGAPTQSVEAWRIFDAIGDCVYARHLNLSAPTAGGPISLTPFFRAWSGFLPLVSSLPSDSDNTGILYPMNFPLSGNQSTTLVFRVNREASGLQYAQAALRMAMNVAAGGADTLMSRRAWRDISGGAPAFDDIALIRTSSGAFGILRLSSGAMQSVKLSISPGSASGPTVGGAFAALPADYVTSAPPTLLAPATGSNEAELFFLVSDGRLQRVAYNFDANSWSTTATTIGSGFSPSVGLTAVRDSNGVISLISNDSDGNLVVIQQTANGWSEKQILASHDSIFATQFQPSAAALPSNEVGLFVVSSLGEPVVMKRDALYRWPSFQPLPGIPFSVTAALGVTASAGEILIGARSGRNQYFGRGLDQP